MVSFIQKFVLYLASYWRALARLFFIGMLAQVLFWQEVDNEENEKQEETSKKRAELLQLREAAFTTLGKAWPRNEQTQGTDNTNCSINVVVVVIVELVKSLSIHISYS